MIRCSWKIALFVIANIMTAGPALAGLLPISATSAPDGANTRYSYGIVLTTDSKVQSGDYFTIFDFPSPVAGTANMPSGWSLNTSPTGGNPNGTVPGDDPHVPNLTWTYSGPTILGQANLGTFSIDSTDSSSVLQPFSFTSLTQTVATNANDSNITSTTVPVGTTGTSGDGGGTPPGVPEPATLVLMGIGLPLAGLVRRFRTQQTAN
jgi:hypothetical protein